jgi:hypothetical protein
MSRGIWFAVVLTLSASAHAEDVQVPVPAPAAGVDWLLLFEPAAPSSGEQCCKICSKGKACGNTCIARDKVCRVGPGCACDA